MKSCDAGKITELTCYIFVTFHVQSTLLPRVKQDHSRKQPFGSLGRFGHQPLFFFYEPKIIIEYFHRVHNEFECKDIPI